MEMSKAMKTGGVTIASGRRVHQQVHVRTSFSSNTATSPSRISELRGEICDGGGDLGEPLGVIDTATAYETDAGAALYASIRHPSTFSS